MTLKELTLKLSELHVLTKYSLDGEQRFDTFALLGWYFYYIDVHGEKEFIASFHSDEEAYDFIYEFALQRIELAKMYKAKSEEFKREESCYVEPQEQVQGQGFTMTSTKRKLKS